MNLLTARNPMPLPVPGLFWGPYPRRTLRLANPQADLLGRALHAGLQHAGHALRALYAHLAPRQTQAHAAWAQPWLNELRTCQQAWANLSSTQHAQRLAELRARLGRDGIGSQRGLLQLEALACASAACIRALGHEPFDTQLIAARAMLDGRLAEMATGEGKTLAAALAAAVAAMAGVPVHVMTVNDYLVQRDAQALTPLFARLSLSVGQVLTPMQGPQRRAAYACNITYCTAREVAFDLLRDRLSGALQQDAVTERLALEPMQSKPEPPRLRGLCMAIVDEADSLLIDEATLPLVLSEAVNDPHHQAACYQAMGLARSLEPGRHFHLLADERRVAWLDAGEQRVEALVSTLGGAWHNRHHRQELVATALQALHLLHESEHYLVRDGEVQLLDAHTGRVADGRKWARSLHTLVELKEGLKPGAHSHTRARCSVQGFFAQYLHLGGMSGTLAACAPELQRLYGARLQAVPLRKPCRRTVWPSRLYASKLQRTTAIVARVGELLAQGRPVLVGCASVADAAALGDALALAGVAHRVLDARHDADEAAVVAQAGQRGAVTVATQMAGRGTDIVLGPGVAACGGLHVINAQDNLDARLDRQLLGRAGRQGDPGSAENWHALDASAWQPWLPRAARRAQATDPQGVCAVPAATVDRWTARLQGRHAAQQRRLRGRLLEQDMEWQRHLSFTSLRA